MRLRGEAGAGLIEIAVALLLLSVGALGLARGQLAARQAASEALQRSEAILLASELLEQVRGNPNALSAYTFGDVSAISTPDHDCAAQSCSTLHWGAWSLWNWLQNLRGSAASDAGGNPVAGLITPQACLSVSQGAALLELSWRAVPAGEIRSCGEAAASAGTYVLSLATRLEATGP